MTITREMIVAEARSWIGTAFKHQGRMKKSYGNRGGCDCIGLIVGVAKVLQLSSGQGWMLDYYDNRHYHRLPHGNDLCDHLGSVVIF